MKKGLIAVIAVVAVVVMAFSWFIGTRNDLVSLQTEVELQQSQVQTTLQRRADLIPNLVSTVKAYAKHEETVYTEIAEARAKLSGSIEQGNIEEMSQASNQLESALSRLLIVVEKYPELQASEQFIALQDELAGTENRINVARQNYNESVAAYNKQIKLFPASIVASSSGFEPMEYFEADEKAQDAPVVNFD